MKYLKNEILNEIFAYYLSLKLLSNVLIISYKRNFCKNLVTILVTITCAINRKIKIV